MAAKIIVLGGLNGNFGSAFKKLATLQAKQNFSFAIITGNLFGIDQDKDEVTRLLSGQIHVPLSTYFTVGTNPLPEEVVKLVEKGEDICENLHYLGKRSITKTSDGVRIVSLGGVLDKSIVGGQSKEQHMPLHTADDAKALRGANSADILLTTMWPAGIWDKSQVTLTPEDQARVASSEEVAELCAALKPRYHFTASPNDFFYEREPFFHPTGLDSGDKAVTRFISVAPFSNPAKQKALYAFNLQVGETTLALPVGSTASPFAPKHNKRTAPTDGDSYGRFARSDDHGRSRRQRRARSPPPGPDRCFFCMSNSNLDTHMICCIGDESYVTTAKGPLPTPDTFASSGLAFPCHQLIVPLPHEPTFRLMGGSGDGTFREMERFREALQAMVATQSKHKLGAVTWEISRQANIHHHWQFLPAPIEMLRKGLVEAGFKVEAENRGYPAFQEANLGSGADEPGDFFRVWLWSDDGDTGLHRKELVMRLDDGFRFDLQFGRKVMAKLLGLEDRADWKNVVQPILDETEDVGKFKEVFKPWDFTE